MRGIFRHFSYTLPPFFSLSLSFSFFMFFFNTLRISFRMLMFKKKKSHAIDNKNRFNGGIVAMNLFSIYVALKYINLNYHK